VRLLQPRETRIGSFEEIQGHPWFKGIDWKNIDSSVAPFVPELDSPEDTKYFDLDDMGNPMLVAVEDGTGYFLFLPLLTFSLSYSSFLSCHFPSSSSLNFSLLTYHSLAFVLLSIIIYWSLLTHHLSLITYHLSLITLSHKQKNNLYPKSFHGIHLQASRLAKYCCEGEYQAGGEADCPFSICFSLFS